ncbi:MAG: hypothetical protein UY02_C0033G0004 [Candidatus Giovannonibacteria bacterium GW2011_GWB1_47_6b]|uniref:Uncharacterized protein n=1 Tax=Candidatus Giovannonibacteria bacterium GW2011_GWB1_47_6b TaxID=1618655 RepID=A0A0G1T2V4_9BACT|nr:MAG: hypothetical protein UY02_C0033G0004 [Candidatus Giovannonibacteria bacterium GW2011_GWB1_47_6b]
MTQSKIHTIFCVECGAPRQVATANWQQVKRCFKHQYLQKRRYNTEYVSNKRKKGIIHHDA